MDKDRIEGIGHQVKGAVKEGLGRIIGHAKLEADGTAERASGKVQNAIGRGMRHATRSQTRMRRAISASKRMGRTMR
jgi:uncharacterized protein YjbJ (UPF0337 family)